MAGKTIRIPTKDASSDAIKTDSSSCRRKESMALSVFAVRWSLQPFPPRGPCPKFASGVWRQRQLHDSTMCELSVKDDDNVRTACCCAHCAAAVSSVRLLLKEQARGRYDGKKPDHHTWKPPLGFKTPPQIKTTQCVGSAPSSTDPVATGARTATGTLVREHGVQTTHSDARTRSRWVRRRCLRSVRTASTETATADGCRSGSFRTRGCAASTSSSGDG